MDLVQSLKNELALANDKSLVNCADLVAQCDKVCAKKLLMNADLKKSLLVRQSSQQSKLNQLNAELSNVQGKSLNNLSNLLQDNVNCVIANLDSINKQLSSLN